MQLELGAEESPGGAAHLDGREGQRRGQAAGSAAAAVVFQLELGMGGRGGAGVSQRLRGRAQGAAVGGVTA